jgi:hypothetical protein
VKRKTLIIGLVLALIGVIALPISALAETTDVTGDFQSSSTFTAPSSVTLTTFDVGDNTGSATTAGNIDTNTSGWTLTVQDSKTYNNGYMTKDGADLADAVVLDSPIQVGTTAVGVGTIASYQTALQGQADYGNPTATFSIPLYVKQTIIETDQAGSYQITLTYTFAPGT